MGEFRELGIIMLIILVFVAAGVLHHVNTLQAETPVQRESAYVERVLALHDRIMQDSYTKDTAAMLQQARLIVNEDRELKRVCKQYPEFWGPSE